MRLEEWGGEAYLANMHAVCHCLPLIARSLLALSPDAESATGADENTAAGGCDPGSRWPGF